MGIAGGGVVVMSDQKEVLFISKGSKYHKVKSVDGFTFFKNDNELKNQEGQLIGLSEFNRILRDELNNYIHLFDNMVVLAGAGASIVSKEDGSPDLLYGHTVKMISTEVLKELRNKDFYSIEQLSNFCKYSVPIEVDSGEGRLEYNDNFNLEDFLSKVVTFEEFIDKDSEIDLEKYKKSKNKILQIIRNKTSYNYDKNKHKHGFLIKNLSNLHKSPNRLTIVTTNYDTLFEEAANYLNFTVFDGFSFDSNPKFDADLFDWSLVKPIANVKSEKMEFKKSTVNLLKIHGSLTWKKSDDDIARVSKEDNDVPIMIFSSSNKYTHSYEKPYFELFSKFQEYIKRTNTLLITTGFSFADNHIAKMITQAIKTTSSLTVLITDHTIDSEYKCANWKELERLMDNGYRIAFLKGTIDDDLVEYFGDKKYDN